MSQTREEHLEWCKTRSREYIVAGDYQQAFTSMASNMSKHPETKDHSPIGLGMALLMNGHLNSESSMRDFIEGFN